MSYMKEWRGKTDPTDKSGDADYMVEGELFTIPLPTFQHARRLDDLLWTTFRQGKSFAFDAIKSHLDRAMINADIAHSFTMERSHDDLGR